MKEILIASAVVTGIVAAFVGMGLAVQYGANSAQCRNLHNLMDVETNVSLSTGCLVKVDGRWMSGDSAVTNTREVTINGR
jgi:hypothetical protein